MEEEHGMSVELMSTLGVLAPLTSVVFPAYEAVVGIGIDPTFDPTNVLSERIAAGRRSHILIAISGFVRELADGGVVSSNSVRDIATTSVGIAKRAGSEPIDISSKGAFIDAMMKARSIVFSQTGASGVFFRDLVERLGIAEEILGKAVIIPQGLTAELLPVGEAEIAVQQMSELKAVPGIDIVGPLPTELNQVTTFTAAMFAGCEKHPGVSALFEFITGDLARQAYLAGGLSLPETAAT